MSQEKKVIGLWRDKVDPGDPASEQAGDPADSAGAIAEGAERAADASAASPYVSVRLGRPLPARMAAPQPDEAAPDVEESEKAAAKEQADAAPALVAAEGPQAGWDDAWDDEAEAQRSRSRDRAIGWCLALAAIAWTGFAGYALLPSWLAQPDPARAAQTVAMIAAPLVLIAIMALWLQRNSLSEANRYGALLAQLEQRSAQLEARLAGATDYIRSSQEQLLRNGDHAVNQSLEAAQHLTDLAGKLADAGNRIVESASAASEQSSIARRNMESVLAGLPKVDVVAQRMAENVRQAGLIAHKHGSNLEAKIAAIGEAGESSALRLTSLSEQLEQRLAELTGQTETLGQSLSAITSGDVARLGEALRASESMAGAIGTLIDTQTDKAASLAARLQADAAANSDALARLDADNAERLARLSAALVALHQRSEEASASMAAGTEQAERFTATSQDVLVALDAILREMDESMPATLARLDGHAASTRALMASIEPGLADAETHVTAMLARLREAEALLAEQAQIFDHVATTGNSTIEEQRQALAVLEDGIGRVRAQSEEVTKSVGPEMVAALVRVRETAGQAADRAREAISSVIPSAADEMAGAVADAMDNAIRGKVEEQMGAISQAAQQAVAAAHHASERLMRQMITIADTSANIERRVEEANAHAEAAIQDNLARTLSLLTDALNSTAIDVTGLLSNDVSDAAWAAYLRGDKGVFTRRAVKLLATSEAREILRRYESDDVFRGHVNRYIHDFETMLKTVMDLRSGQSISVTLLSSDIGKLYVALAQAIERLRG